MPRPKLLILVSAFAQPRVKKRIRMLERGPWDITIAAVDRVNYLHAPPLDPSVVNLGGVAVGALAGRFPLALRSIRRLRKLGRFDLVYAFTAELGLYARLAQCAPSMAVEISDIHGALTRPGLVSAILRRTDAAVVERADLTVVTSEHYLKHFYGEMCGVHPSSTMVIENKIDRATWERMGARWRAGRERWGGGRDGKPMTIGFFGVVNCLDTYRALEAWAASRPTERRLVVRGQPFSSGPRIADMQGKAHVAFGGTYRWPDDLEDMYTNVDIVCAAFPVSGYAPANWQWARTNRFYEACSFGRPVLTLAGGGDEDRVLGLGIGASVPFGDTDSAIEQLDAITWDTVNDWRANSLRVPDSTYVEVDEGERLNRALTELLERR